MRYELDSSFQDKKTSLLEIENTFSKATNSIHKARNEIKIIDGMVVKSFKIPHFINKVAYSFFRASKAKRSFLNAQKIADFTPKPVGYIEFFKFGLLEQSYYISEHFAYDFTIREPLDDKNFPDRDAIFEALAKFTYALHQAGIFHKDYSPGNILIKKETKHYKFMLVDINRMYFPRFTTSLRMKNFAKLGASNEDLKLLIHTYANAMHVDAATLYNEAIRYSKLHQDKIARKRKVKKVFR